jgi:starch synthase
LIYAAADLFIIPSLFEPCGLTQLIALRYAAVPVARATGGLVDTVFDIDTSKKPMNERNGFTFDFPDTKGIDWALDRALNKWFQERTQWHQLMQQAIRTDFSWTHSATEYVKLYHSLIR